MTELLFAVGALALVCLASGYLLGRQDGERSYRQKLRGKA